MARYYFRRNRNIIYLILGIGFFIIVLNIIQSRNILSSEYYQITLWMTGLIPTLITIGMGFIYFRRGTSSLFGDIIISGVIGVGIAESVRYFYNNNIWFDTVITGSNTIEEYMVMIIFLWVLLGIIIGIIRR
jgi:hypothetical protein